MTPTGFPHVSLADDEYGGMFIPAGSIVLANGRYAVRPLHPVCVEEQ